MLLEDTVATQGQIKISVCSRRCCIEDERVVKICIMLVLRDVRSFNPQRFSDESGRDESLKDQ